VESQLSTTGDLNLLAQDTVQVRDSATNPFIAHAGGNLYIQGNQSIDILALNHLSQTPLVSGGNLSLVSDGDISGDAHFAAGGNISILKLDGGGGNLHSLYDPIFSVGGDYIQPGGSYTGAALKVQAGGNIVFDGDINITSPDTALAGATPGSDEFLLGNFRALILRAGGDIKAGNITTNPEATNFQVTGNTGAVILEAASNIQTGNINADNSFGDAGSITLTASGDISTGEVRAINAATNVGKGGLITLNAGGKITINGNIASFSALSDGSDIRLRATGDIILKCIPTVFCGMESFAGGLKDIAPRGNSGNITLISEAGAIMLGANLNASNPGSGTPGNITLSAYNNITILGLDSSTNAPGIASGAITVTSTVGKIDGTGGVIDTNSQTIKGGNIILSAADDISTENIQSNGLGRVIK
jgi:hypothetical protein